MNNSKLSGKYPILQFVYPNQRTGFDVLRKVQLLDEDAKFLAGIEMDGTVRGKPQYKRYFKNKVNGTINFVKMELPLKST
jgi:hypothetical protein